MTEIEEWNTPTGMMVTVNMDEADAEIMCCPVRTAEVIAKDHQIELDSYALLRLIDNCAMCKYHKKQVVE